MPTGPQVVWSPEELGTASRMAHRQIWQQGWLPFSGKPNSSASIKVVYIDAIASVARRAKCRFERIGYVQIGQRAEFTHATR